VKQPNWDPNVPDERIKNKVAELLQDNEFLHGPKNEEVCMPSVKHDNIAETDLNGQGGSPQADQPRYGAPHHAILLYSSALGWGYLQR
jgi:hypothetical protein